MGLQPVNGSQQTARFAGTCLHLGADGERCYRPALASGFCEKHDPEFRSSAPGSWLRAIAALLLLFALLWPLISDVLRELRGWLR